MTVSVGVLTTGVECGWKRWVRGGDRSADRWGTFEAGSDIVLLAGAAIRVSVSGQVAGLIVGSGKAVHGFSLL